MNKQLIPTEEQEQVTLAQWLDLHGICWFHTPNGGHRNVVVAKKLKDQGVKPGVPDVIVVDRPPKSRDNVGVAIELKREKGGSVSPDQRQWLDSLRERGWIVAVCRGAGEAINLLEELGYGRKHKGRKDAK